MEILFRHLDFTGRVFVGWTVSPIKEEPGPAARVGLAVQVGEYGRLRPFETLEPPLGNRFEVLTVPGHSEGVQVP